MIAECVSFDVLMMVSQDEPLRSAELKSRK